MRAATAVLVLGFLAAGAGCDGGEPAALDLSVTSSCSGTLAGAVTALVTSCRVTWDEKSGTAALGNDGILAVTAPSAVVDDDTFGFTMTVPGDAHAGVFDYGSVTDAAAGVYLYDDGGTAHYAAFFTGVAGGPPTYGSVSVHLTGTTVDFTHGDEKQWIVHGHLDATLVRPPPSTLTDSVTLALDF